MAFVIKRLLIAIPLLLGAFMMTSLTAPSGETYYKQKAIVLIYHDLDLRNDHVSITPAVFESHMKALEDKGYHVISMEQFLNFKKNNKSIPSNAVLLTFDDGYEDFYHKIYPTLRKYKYPATNFIIVSSTDTPKPKAFPHLTWDEMREMKKHGMEFHSHTYDLHFLTDEAHQSKPALTNPLFLAKENRLQTKEEHRTTVANDLALSYQRLREELRNKTNIVCFPYGAYNDETLELGDSVNTDLFFTSDEGINKPGGNMAFRINVGLNRITDADLIEILERTWKADENPSA